MPGQRYSILLAAAIVATSFVALCIGAAEPDAMNLRNGSPDNGQKCLEALVNPVSGHAECVIPAGAAVTQPHREDVPCAVGDAGSRIDRKPCNRDPSSGESR